MPNVIPDDPGSLAYYQQAVEFIDDGERLRAGNMLRDLVRSFPEWLDPRLRLTRLLMERKKQGPALQQMLEMVRLHPEHPDVLAMASRMIELWGGEPELEPLIDALVASGDTRPNTWAARALARFRHGDKEGLLKAVEMLKETKKPTTRHLEAARLLVRMGESAQAESWMRDALDVVSASGEQLALRQQISDFLSSELAGDTGERLQGSSHVIIHRAAEPRATVVVFTGIAQKTGVPPSVMHSWFQPHNVNVVTLSDPSRLTYLTGLPPLGDTFAETVRGLKALLDDLKAPKVYFYGHSLGGYSALRYALELPVDEVLVTAPATTLIREGVFGRDNERRGTLLTQRLEKVAPERIEDLREPIRRRPGKFPITLLYGAGMEADTQHAENVYDLPNVTVVPIRGLDSHDVPRHLSESGQIFDLFSLFVTGALTPENARVFATPGKAT